VNEMLLFLDGKQRMDTNSETKDSLLGLELRPFTPRQKDKANAEQQFQAEFSKAYLAYLNEMAESRSQEHEMQI